MSGPNKSTHQTTLMRPESKPSHELKPKGRSSATFPASQIPHLQGTIGNQAVQRLFSAGIIQTKLKVGEADDIYEQQADGVAEQVMNSGGEKHQSGVGNRESGVRGEGGLIQTKPG